MILDSHGRPVKNIRISVNEECNLGCYYCHGEGQEGTGSKMTPEEIGRILAIAAEYGVTKVKLTGGEPLIRDDIQEIVRHASSHMEEVSMTTNGTLLAPIARELKNEGLKRVNISLDTTDRKRYCRITGRDKLDDAIEGIRTSVKAGLDPVKVNIVAMEGTTVKDIMRTVELVWDMGAFPQVIEPVGSSEPGPIEQLEKDISSKAVEMREREMHRRKVYTLENRKGIEIVRPMHNTVFCAHCSRIRVTSDGKLKPCLMHNDGLVDILGPIRQNADIDKLRSLFEEAVGNRIPYWK